MMRQDITTSSRDRSGKIIYETPNVVEAMEIALKRRGFTKHTYDLCWRREEDSTTFSEESVRDIAEVWGRGACEAVLRIIDSGNASPIVVETKDRADGGLDVSIRPLHPLEQLAEQAE